MTDAEPRRTDDRPRLPRVIEAAAIILFLVVATGFAVVTPPKGAPDEHGHTVYARAISHGRLPTPAAATSVRPGPGGRIDYNCAQAHHPPLYYGIVGGIYALTGRQAALLAPIGRVVSILAGLGALLLIRAAMHRIFPERPRAIAAGLAFAAASATFTYTMGSFNNDPLSVLLVCAAIYCGARALHGLQPMGWLLATGAALGVGLLTKLTAAVAVIPLLLAAGSVLWRDRPDARRQALLGAAGGLLLAAVISGPWFVRNYLVVGAVTFNCAVRPPLFNTMAEVIFQPDASLLATAMAVEELLAGAWWPGWLLRDYHNLVADLAMAGGLTTDSRPVWLILLPLAVTLVAVGGVLRSVRAIGRQAAGADRRALLWILLLVPVMTVLGIIHQGLLVDGHVIRWAGRYVSVMMPALAMVLGIGLSELLPRRGRSALPLVALMAAVAVNGWALLRVMRFYSS